MHRSIALGLFLCLGLVAQQPAAAADADDIPEVLRSWIPWVLHGQERSLCPAPHGDAKQRLCAWPARLRLDLNGSGGRFTQQWRVYKRGWVPLPGSTAQWPEEVRLEGRAAVVTDRNGVPHLRLEPGRHRVTGGFAWRQLPKSLRVPKAVGLIDLSIDGQAEPFPDRDTDGSLWLRDRAPSAPADRDDQDRLTLQVFRHLADDIPMRLTTRIRLDVSGKHREVVIGPALPAEAIPLAIESALPARLESAGRLRVQIRPGTWVVTVIARLPAPVDRLARPAADPPWPADEAWVFEAHNDLRLVEIEGVETIDPRQTSLPAEWQQLPAYRVAAGQVLEIVTKRRGDPDPAPDRLRLKRTLWLDFDGGGYTFSDKIEGAMRAGWRLDMNRPFALGRVAVDGEDRFITRTGATDAAGVELRQGKIDLVADGRLDGVLGSFSAVGWAHDFQALDTVLHLPPGWRLAHVGGADSVTRTWLQQWTMLSLFLVLVVALSVGRLWNWWWGLLALAALALTLHEPWAPKWIWLNVLAAVALVRVVPAGNLRFAVTWYRNLSLLALLLMALPFMILEVRGALYPQLEGPRFSPQPRVAAVRGTTAPQAQRRRPEQSKSSVADKRATLERKILKDSADFGLPSSYSYYDPAAKITTGPGVPRWTWTTVRLRWNGPVERGQTLRLTLVPPWMTRILRLVAVVLVAALAGLILASSFKLRPRRAPAAASVLAGLLAAAAAVPPGAARAEMPDPALLDSLRDRLLETPDCFPHCAQSPSLTLDIDADRMTARFAVDAAEAVAVPLPGDPRYWYPRRVEIDGVPVPALRRDDKRILWAYLPAGRHVIVIEGALANQAALPVPLPLRPHRVTVRARGWGVEGIDENGVPQAQLQLVRIRDTAPALESLSPEALPPFLRIERTLILGLEWRTLTRVLRDPASRGAVVMKVPTLDGESVTTAGLRVEDGAVLVNMTEAQRQLRWTATLARAETLSLTAPPTTDWTETWRLDASPIWHIRSDGLTPIFHQNPNGIWRPTWRPWPGESLRLAVSRPAGVEGPTRTIEHSLLELRPGKRSTSAALTLDLLSSQGGQHELRLPDGIRLESVSIDGRLEPVRAQDGKVILPIAPGRHSIAVKWREDRAVGAWFDASAVNLNLPSVNAEVVLSLPRDRWVLFTQGPRLGPAVLFWPVLLVLLGIAVGLGRTRLTPLRTHHWFLLGIGLTQAPVPVAVLVVGWLFALGARRRLPDNVGKWTFNIVQIGLAVLTLVALGGLFEAVRNGLLGQPEMQVMGNGSRAYALRWYQDRVEDLLPPAAVLSVSIWFYKLLMLAWALWLAFALLGWARWGWESYAAGGLWRPIRAAKPEPPPPAAPPAEASAE